jgi:hypothetical protein
MWQSTRPRQLPGSRAKFRLASIDPGRGGGGNSRLAGDATATLFRGDSGRRSILESQRPERVHVLYFDSEVQKAETYCAGEPVHLHPIGGGGTEFGPCFDWLDEHGIQPQTLVILTDLYGSFPPSAPAFSVLWASTGSQKAPFGQVIRMQAA